MLIIISTVQQWLYLISKLIEHKQNTWLTQVISTLYVHVLPGVTMIGRYTIQVYMYWYGEYSVKLIITFWVD